MNENDILRQLAGLVATELGDGWSVDPKSYTHSPRLVGPTGETIILLKAGPYSNPTERVQVRGVFTDRDHKPYDLDLRSKFGTVARDRGPKAVASLIRRHLAEYNEHRAILTAAAGEHQEAASAARSAAQGLGAVLGTEPRAEGSHGLSHRLSVGLLDGSSNRIGWGDFSVNGSSVYIELRQVPIELAEKIAALIAEEASK